MKQSCKEYEKKVSLEISLRWHLMFNKVALALVSENALCALEIV